MTPDPPVDLRLLLKGTDRTATIRSEEIPGVLGDLERLRAELWSRLFSSAGGVASGPGIPTDGDRLLAIKEAAETLGVSTDWLYRQAPKLPFTVHLGGRQLRFSMQGIQRYIRTRMGR